MSEGFLQTENMKRCEDMQSDLETVKVDVKELKEHKDMCIKQHEINEQHRKRSDDAMNNLANSNLLLAQSINSMNITISEIVKDDRPITKRSKSFWDFYDKLVIWLTFNRTVVKWFGGGIIATAAVVTALKTLGVI